MEVPCLSSGRRCRAITWPVARRPPTSPKRGRGSRSKAPARWSGSRRSRRKRGRGRQRARYIAAYSRRAGATPMHPGMPSMPRAARGRGPCRSLRRPRPPVVRPPQAAPGDLRVRLAVASRRRGPPVSGARTIWRRGRGDPALPPPSGDPTLLASAPSRGARRDRRHRPALLPRRPLTFWGRSTACQLGSVPLLVRMILCRYLCVESSAVCGGEVRRNDGERSR